MNGATSNNYWNHQSDGDPQQQEFQTITNAINATLDPRVSNEVRQQAFQHLEQIKRQPDAPQNGFLLAEDWAQKDAVRYYGLQLLEHAVRYRWAEYNPGQTAQVREWVTRLVGSVREQDALFIRNKVAQLWAEVAKRCWGDEWMDMDALLVTLWDKPVEDKGMVNKILVLYVLETLSEDIVNSEDAVAGLRLDVLGQALNEIMAPPGLYAELAAHQDLRCGEEGWLARMCGFFSTCVKQARMETSAELRSSMSACAVKALNALRPTMAWISLKGAVEVDCIDCLFLPFHTDDVPLRIAATEVLHSLLNRPYAHHAHDPRMMLSRQALHPDRVSLLRQTFDNIRISPGEDDEQYTMQKRLSELLSVLADTLAIHPELADSDDGAAMPAFFDLLQRVLENPSLTVSIPVLHSFTKLMAVDDTTVVNLVFQAFGPLIQTCSPRLLRYECLSDDTQNETAQYLFDDFDTMPERHAFLGNYRRYCVNIIQTITTSKPLEALSHVLGQMSALLDSRVYASSSVKTASYSKNDPSVLQFDAQFQVVGSALKGYSAWLDDTSNSSEEDEAHASTVAERQDVAASLQQWCYGIINTHIGDPEVAAQVLQTLVLILQTIKPEPQFVLQVVQHLLTMRLYDDQEHAAFSESVRSFESLRVVELQRLALTFADQLIEVYHELEPRVGVLAEKHKDEPRLLWGYKGFLFIIIHRGLDIDWESRTARLQAMLKPVYEAWQDPTLAASLTSLESFCSFLGMDVLPDFYKSYGFDKATDWSALQLDERGQAKQTEIRAKVEALPLRMTKSLLAVSTEKLKPISDPLEMSYELWSPLLPVILPRLLQMLRHAQAFHNLDNWSHLPEELQAVVKRTLQDRFWQSGISNESKDEFYARITGSKTSYEGFASTIRGSMRSIREQGYHMLYLMGKLDLSFYSLTDLAHPLAEALFADAGALSATHLHPIINLSTGMVQQCPPHYRAHFLPPLLIQLFDKLDRKISGEWDAIKHISEMNREDDALNDEMRTESVLRQLTYSMVTFVTFLLSFDRTRPPQGEPADSYKPSLKELVVSDSAVLEPLIMFCTHALRMRDTRCCTMICKVFRNMIPLFASDAPPAPQVRDFISTEVLKACIESLNEPYFADMQKDLAMLIAQIILFYSPKTDTPRNILLSLPDMAAPRVEKALAKICKSPNERQQRAFVLDLLEGVRGVSIHEQGKMPKEKKKPAKIATQQQYMEIEPRPTIVNGDDIGLDGVAGLFGDS